MKSIKTPFIILLSLAIGSVLFSSCESRCIDGNGTITTENRALSGFSAITMEGDFDVFVQQDTIYEVKVEADQNIQPYVVTEVRSTGTLEIKNANNRCLRGSDRIRVTIKTPDLYKLTNAGSGYIYCKNVYNDQFSVVLSGSGEIECYNIDTYNLTASLPGSGKLTLDGVTRTSSITMSGSGLIKAYNLDQDESTVTLSGSGDIYVFAFDYLDILISGSGRVFYRGGHRVDYKIPGSGRVIDDN